MTTAAKDPLLVTLDASAMMRDAICLLMALGRERLLGVAGGYLMVDVPAVAAELRTLDLEGLACRATCRGIVCGELDDLCDAAREALDKMSPAEQLAAAREWMT